MKKKLLTFSFLLLSTCILSTASFAQTAPGDAGSGGLPPDGGGTVSTPPVIPTLTFDFGAAGILSIAPTSNCYSLITSFLTTIHATIAPDGSVTFPTVSSYQTCLLPLYYTGYINTKTYQTCKYQTPPPCTYPKTSCGR